MAGEARVDSGPIRFNHSVYNLSKPNHGASHVFSRRASPQLAAASAAPFDVKWIRFDSGRALFCPRAPRQRRPRQSEKTRSGPRGASRLLCGTREPVALMLREKSKQAVPVRMRVPMRGTGTEQPVGVMK